MSSSSNMSRKSAASAPGPQQPTRPPRGLRERVLKKATHSTVSEKCMATQPHATLTELKPSKRASSLKLDTQKHTEAPGRKQKSIATQEVTDVPVEALPEPEATTSQCSAASSTVHATTHGHTHTREGATEEDVNERIINWAACGISPPKPILSDDESSVASTIETSAESSRRVSMLYPASKRRTGATMDLASQVANELLLRGKDALEATGNMKRELKATVHECMQGLYETALSLVDSRARNVNNLERERTRHAQELVRVERAHSKEMAAMRETLAKELSLARADITGTLQEAKWIHGWLGHETREPYRGIKEIERGIQALHQKLDNSATTGAENATPQSNPKWDAMEANISRLSQAIATVSNQLDSLRRTVEKVNADLDTQKEPTQAMHMFPEFPEVAALEEEIRQLKMIAQKILDKPACCPTPPPPPPPIDLAKHLEPLSDRLQLVSSDIRELRDTKPQAPSHPAPNLEAELAMAEVKQKLETIEKGVSHLSSAEKPMQGPITFAQALSRPPPPKLPNHTLIIGSTDPKHTGDQVIECVTKALDFKKTGAKVNKVRKARNQKIVVNCASKEDLKLVRDKVEGDKKLTVQEPKPANPLACIRGVLSINTDVEIVELIKAQNKHLLQDIEVDRQTIKMRYRRRARNPHECHPVLELSPAVWKRFLEAEKVHIGMQRCRVEDQSPLVQCTRCLAYGHSKSVCKAEKETCSYCGETHTGRNCPSKSDGKSPVCINCKIAKREGKEVSHVAFSDECQEKVKWDNIARSKVSYC